MSKLETIRPRKRVNLAQRYESEIRSWNWKSIKEHCSDNLHIEDGSLIGSSYLGSILNIYPSGKCYAPWTTNQSGSDIVRDQLFGEILETVADEYALSIGGSDGDGLDLLAYAYFGEDFYSISQDGDESIAVDAWGNEEFRADTEEFDAGLKAHLEEQEYFPDLVTISDHGDVSRYNLDS